MMLKHTNRTSTISTANAALALSLLLVGHSSAPAQELPSITSVEQQPLVAATERLLQALEYVGAPLAEQDATALKAALGDSDKPRSITSIQKILDPYCLVGVHINPESRVKVAEGPAAKVLVQQGWRSFLVKVHNEAGITPQLLAESPNAAPLYMRGRGKRQRPQQEQKLVTPAQATQRFLDLAMYRRQPLKPNLSGLALEYRILQVYSRDQGRREANLAFNVGQGTQDIGFRNSVPILFRCVPAVEVVLGVKDTDGSPTTAAFVIRDELGRVYPNPARRLAPDFFFHNQIYRADGESVHLPSGKYSIEVARGPEYLVRSYPLTVKKGIVSQRQEIRLQRWTHPAKRQWFSGDHHIHAAGCAHYDSPTEGVAPADMMRHILGEDLNVGCVLSWGPCWYTQKQYFEGKQSALSQPNYLMRYDVEVSGFPSSHCGHLCLLALQEDDYPGTNVIEEWPSWTLPVLKWGKEQGGVVGYSHSGWGLQLPDFMPGGDRKFPQTRWGGANPGWTGRPADTLPDYAMPRFDGIGANEYVVTVAHDVCDFISAVDTPAIWELNVWYHTLNCGYRARISGETDFPCIYGDKVGLGRIYVKLNPDQDLTFDNWIQGVKAGRSYCGDGRSHIFDFKVNNVAVGESGSNGQVSQLELGNPEKVKVTFDVAALLAEKPTAQTERIRNARLDQKPYWHIERCRIGNTRQVPVELIVNGYPAKTKKINADGSTQSVSFDVDLKYSSWIAVRILPSVHTNPVFVQIGGRPIRASRRSAEWCRQAVDVCWNAKKDNIGRDALHQGDRAEARWAYDYARKMYEQILAESVAD